MSLPELQNLIHFIGAEIVVIVTSLMVAYYKISSKFDKKIQEVKTHTAISIQRLNGMLSYVINSFDRPAWIKVAHIRPDGEIEFRMLDINSCYCKEFGFEKTLYLGKTDLEAGWASSEASQFRKHDLAVWAGGEAETFVETIKGRPRTFRRLRVQSSDGVVKGVMGYEIENPQKTS